MLVPAGDASDGGRALYTTSESAETTACARELKNAIETTYHGVHAVVSHDADTQPFAPYHVATMANIGDIDFVININFYRDEDGKLEVFLYHFSYGQEFVSKLPTLAWYTADQAYLFARGLTREWATLLCDGLKGFGPAHPLAVHGPYAMPFKPLVGIKVPAVALDMALSPGDTSWKNYIEPLTAGLEPIVDELRKRLTAPGLAVS